MRNLVDGCRRRPCLRDVHLVAAAVACLSGSGIAHAQAPAALAPESVSFYGDPSAPNLSGVWQLAGPADKAAPDQEGWRPWPPQLKGAFAAQWQKHKAEEATGKRTDDPVQGCLPPGLPRFITGDKSPLLIQQTPGRVMMSRDGEGPRRIWLDGRGLPTPDETEPFPKGTSIGRYDGQDLVVETVGMKDYPIDSTGVPHSPALRISERFHRLDPQTLQVQVTLNDPAAYARPLVSTVIYKALDAKSWEPREFLCTPKTNYHPGRYVH